MPRSDYDEPLKVSQVVGGVGFDPETRETSAGDVMNFSVAQTKNYGEDKDATRWWRVAVWNEDLQREVKANVSKGVQVVVEGKVTKEDYKGTTQYNITAYRVGLADWFVRGGGSSKREEEYDEDDDL